MIRKSLDALYLWSGYALAEAFFLAVASAGCIASAAEIKVLSGTGSRAIVEELALQFERASGHKLVIRFEGNAELKRKIEADETFDVAILNPPVINDLIKAGKIVGERADIGQAGIGVGVRAGAPKPDIGTVDAFKRALLAAKSVAFAKEGASGIHFMIVLERLGLAEQLKAKLRPMPALDSVEVVGRGEAEMVVVVLPRILVVPGVDLVGPIPAELQTWIGTSAGVGAAAREPEAAHALIRFFTGPAAIPVLKAKGMEPG